MSRVRRTRSKAPAVLAARRAQACAPLLNLQPAAFLAQLIEQYLFAALQAILYEALLSENQHRVRHLEGAVRHLEQRAEELQRRLRLLRQEEIIEEIEVILLNAATAEPG